MKRIWTVLALLPVALGGCGAATPSSFLPLGRPTDAGAGSALVGDPSPERGGTVRTSQEAVGGNATPHVLGSSSPQAALRRYALAYTNWSASMLHDRERELISLSVGSARSAAALTAASASRTHELVAFDVSNHGVVLTIGPGQGPTRGHWVIVTLEQTTGAGPYAGIPASPHVIVATALRRAQGWVVAEWSPQS